MKSQYLKLSPVYPNKWHFYLSKLQNTSTCDAEALEFNWFSCGKPYTKNNITVLEVDKYTTFFDTQTGKSYHVTFDATEVQACILKIVNSDTFTINTTKRAIQEGYRGIAAYKQHKPSCDLVCSDVDMIFDKKVLEESTLCPYINYARVHAPILLKEIKGFPDSKTLKHAKPGKLSIKLRSLLRPYFM